MNSTIKEINVLKWESLQGLSESQIEEKVMEILSIMTLEDKISQMSADWRMIGPKGFSMAKRYNSKPIPAGRNEKLGIPGVLFSDGPRGCVMGSSTCFPVSMARGATWDVELEERIGNAVGIECVAQGANYFGGVCINLLRHPSWGRAQETYGEDPYHLGEMGAALTRGIQKHMMACAKHYACNSMENARFKVNVKIDERSLREIYLPHFKRCVDEGVASIMNAYNKINGNYCGHNQHLLTTILKKDWDFKGFVITDFVLGIRDGLLAVNAGVDIEYPFKWRMKPSKLLKLLKKKKITEEQINDSVIRILRQQLRFNKKKDVKLYSKEKIACNEHIQIALEAARKGMVLLKNEGNILPISQDKAKKIAVIGKLADYENIGDLGSSRVYPSRVVTLLEGIKDKANKNIQILYNEGENLEETKNLVKDADHIIIVVGYTHRDEGEYVFSKGGDRTTLNLRPEDENLITSMAEINKNIIVVLESGSAIITEPWKEKVAAIIMAWYPGMEGGTALAEIIFGEINPSGKLPIVFPKSMDHLPYFDKKAELIEYGYYQGYNLMDKEGFEPAFPFGFGLSYTSFSYKNLKLDKNSISKEEELRVSIDITNTGNVLGEEIVQLYVGYNNSSVEHHVKDLKGFKRLALKPGETKTTTLKLKAKDLAYYDVEKKYWIIEPIEYNVFVGSSSRLGDLLETTFKIH